MTTTAPTPLELVAVRPYREADADFFYRSFLDSFGRGSPITANIPKSIYYPAQRALIERLVRRPDAALVMACLKEDEATLIGFLLAELGSRSTLHFAYVKSAFRRYGVATLMLQELGLTPATLSYTHRTYDATWLSAKWPSAKYNPYLLEEPSWTTPSP